MMETQSLDWKVNFQFPNMVRIGVDADGSCFFHAIAYSFCIPYRQGHINGVSFNRRKFIKNLRFDLAEKLKEKIDPDDSDSPRNYDILSRGKLGDFFENHKKSRNDKQTNSPYSLENMIDELKFGNSVDNIYNEFISNELEKDIYIIDYNTKDVYITGDDFDILYLGRPSIVILSISGHYELVGIKTKTGISTLFSPTDSFIQAISLRMREKIVQGSGNLNLYES